jgi:hypothetical protein
MAPESNYAHGQNYHLWKERKRNRRLHNSALHAHLRAHQ